MIVRRSKQTKIIASLLTAILLASCSPKLQEAKENSFPQSRRVFSTSHQDEKLAVKKVSAEQLLNQVSATDQMKTGELLRSVGGLYSLSKIHGSSDLKTLADGIDKQFYTSVDTTTKIRFEQSPLIQAVLGYSKEYTDLAANLLKLIEGSVKTYAWPKTVKFKNYEVESQRYVSWIIDQVRSELKSKKIEISDAAVADGEAAILEQIASRQEGLETAVNAVKISESGAMLQSNLSDLMTDSLIIDLESDDSAAFSKLLASVTSLATIVDAITDKASADKALSAAKSELTEAELKTVDTTSPEATKSSLIKVLATSFLKKTEVIAAAQSFPQLPNQLLTLGAMGIGLELAQIKAIAANPKQELKKIAAQFGESQLASAPAGITGIESDEIDVVFQSNSLKILSKKSKLKETKTSAEAIGASLSNSIAKATEANGQQKSDTPEIKALLISQLNKLVLLGGFKTEDDKVASYTTVQDSESTPVEILKGAPNQVSAVSDDFTVARNLTPIKTVNSVSVRGQAALLKGLSDTIFFLRDWEESGFEKGLGQFTIAQALGSETTEGPLAKPLFDKSLMFTLAIGNAATVLENTKKKSTPFFLMGPTDSAEWLDKLPLKDSNGNEIKDSRATGGIVDIVKGRRSTVTKTGDIALYILAVSSFLKSTEGIEDTKSPLLRSVDSKTGKSKLDQLIEARVQLKMLLTTLANMLSGTLQQSDGSFAARFNMETRKTQGNASAVDTALAIEALVEVANEFNALVYSDAALEGFYSMNRNLFDKELQFYTQEAGGNQVPSYGDLVSILNSINSLKAYMPKQSKAQWDAIAKNWVGALELLAKNLEAAKK